MCFLRIKKSDLRRDTFCAGGKGGQKQNKTATGVRYTHLETGITAESREHRTQYQNDKAAWRKITQRLIDHFVGEDITQRFAAGAEVVRTYNFAENRIKDHRTGKEYSVKQTFNKDDYIFIEDRLKSTIS